MNIKTQRPYKDAAKQIYTLVKETNILDLNSEYLYLLQTTHFRDYCCVALSDEEVIGFVSGYIIPDRRDSFFVWQVAVKSIARGQGIAAKMILDILQRDSLKDVKYIHTTISPSNSSSIRLFEKLSQEYGVSLTKETLFKVENFHDAHEDEVLYKIELKKENKYENI